MTEEETLESSDAKIDLGDFGKDVDLGDFGKDIDLGDLLAFSGPRE